MVPPLALFQPVEIRDLEVVHLSGNHFRCYSERLWLYLLYGQLSANRSTSERGIAVASIQIVDSTLDAMTSCVIGVQQELVSCYVCPGGKHVSSTLVC